MVYFYRILGGYYIDIKEAPYQINYGDRCGGILLSQQWAITTAHCGFELYIRIGSQYQLKGQKVMIVTHIIHPKYRFEHEFDYDVQLLMLKRKLHFKERVMSIGISERHNGIVRVAGWGYDKEHGEYSDLLQQVELNIIPKEICQAVNYLEYNHTLTDRMFCAGGKDRDACQGDSGGAAVSLSAAVGMSSFGYGCGRGVPGVYVNLTHKEIRRWIRKHTGI